MTKIKKSKTQDNTNKEIRSLISIMKNIDNNLNKILNKKHKLQKTGTVRKKKIKIIK